MISNEKILAAKRIDSQNNFQMSDMFLRADNSL